MEEVTRPSWSLITKAIQAHYDRKVAEGKWAFPKKHIMFWCVAPGDYGYDDGTDIAPNIDERIYGEE